MKKIIDYLFYSLFTVLIFSTSAAQGFAFLSILLWIISFFQQKKTNLFRTFLGIAVALFIVFRLLSIPFSLDPFTSLRAAGKVFFYLIFFVILDNLEVENKKKLQKQLGIFFYTAVIAAGYGILKYLLGIENRISSTTSGHATLGMYLTATFAPILYLGHNCEWFPKRFIWWVVIGFISLGIILTFGRIHWLIAVLLVGIIGVKYERKMLLLSFLLFLGLLVFFQPFRERILTLRSPLQESSGRNILWEDALGKLWRRPVLGYGLNSFKKVYTSWGKLDGVYTWHNEFLQMYLESGILGLVSFLFLFGAIFFLAGKLSKEVVDPFYKDLVIALSFSFLTFFLTCFVGGFLLDPITSLQFFIFAGILGKLQIIYKT